MPALRAERGVRRAAQGEYTHLQSPSAILLGDNPLRALFDAILVIYERGAQFAFDETADFFTARDAEDLRQLENDYARVVYENDAYRLFEIK